MSKRRTATHGGPKSSSISFTRSPRTKALTDFEVELADFPHGGRGKEIRLTEHFSDGDWITTFFRYDAFERHYVDYLTSVP